MLFIIKKKTIYKNFRFFKTNISLVTSGDNRCQINESATAHRHAGADVDCDVHDRWPRVRHGARTVEDLHVRLIVCHTAFYDCSCNHLQSTNNINNNNNYTNKIFQLTNTAIGT